MPSFKKIAATMVAISFTTSLSGPATAAEPKGYMITCTNDDGAIFLSVTPEQMRGTPTNIPFSIKTFDGKEGVGVFSQANVDNDDFLNSIVFGFMSDVSVMALAVPGHKKDDLESQQTYHAKGDVTAQTTNDLIFDGSTVDCLVMTE